MNPFVFAYFPVRYARYSKGLDGDMEFLRHIVDLIGKLYVLWLEMEAMRTPAVKPEKVQ